MEAQPPETTSRKDMFVSVGWTVRSIVLPEKRFVWKIRSTPPFSFVSQSVSYTCEKSSGREGGKGRTVPASAIAREVSRSLSDALVVSMPYLISLMNLTRSSIFSCTGALVS